MYGVAQDSAQESASANQKNLVALFGQHGCVHCPASVVNKSAPFLAGFIDVEADEIAPGYAVLLMYMMLVSTAQGRDTAAAAADK
jgi:hypothetical protein